MIEELWKDFLLKFEGDFHRSQSGQKHPFICNLLQIILIYYMFFGNTWLTLRYSVQKLFF